MSPLNMLQIEISNKIQFESTMNIRLVLEANLFGLSLNIQFTEICWIASNNAQECENFVMKFSVSMKGFAGVEDLHCQNDNFIL